MDQEEKQLTASEMGKLGAQTNLKKGKEYFAELGRRSAEKRKQSGYYTKLKKQRAKAKKGKQGIVSQVADFLKGDL